jgi:hypothetical protein
MQERTPLKNVLIVVGCILLIFSIFAKQLGIDNDEGWGTGRIAILGLGLALVLTGLFAYRFPEQFSQLIQLIIARKHLVFAVALVLVIYAWVSQVESEFLENDYQYYAELAKSFKNGRLYLAERPSEALLALSDPYDYYLRREANVRDFPWDVSLYKQKFYLYYGPVPALFLSVLGNETISQIGDRHLVVTFALGLFVYATLTLLLFFKRSNPNAPAWLVVISILTIGLTAPTAVVIRESRLYQVAALGAQFFFIGGCYWIYAALTHRRPNIWKLGLAGVHWALALGTRISIAPMILYGTVVTVICGFIMYKASTNEKLVPIFAIGIPLLVAALSLAWYNQARFDSIFEFGLRYTLTDINYPQARNVFSAQHIDRNFYNYFLHPFRLRPHFPYLIRIEYLPSSERLAGYLFIAPYILFALLPIFFVGRRILAREKLPSFSTIRVDPEFWLLLTSAGSAMIGAIVILSFWTVQLRYTEDFMPSLLLFVTANVAMGYRALENEVRWRKLFILVIFLLTSITIVASTLVAFKTDSLKFWVNLADSILRILNLK